jgi:hypothetical protein
MNGTTMREQLLKVRSGWDTLPGIVDALGKLPAILSAMPAAPVVIGAVTRIAADAIAGELRRRGPSARLVDLCAAHGLDETVATEIYGVMVDDVRA